MGIYIYIYIILCPSLSMKTSDQPYDWGWSLWVRRWLIRPIWAWKSIGQWEKRMVVAVVDVTVPFLSFLCSSVAVFLLVLQTFARRLTTSRHSSSLSCARYSRQLRMTPKRFQEDLQCVFEDLFFWPRWQGLLRYISPWSSFFGRR